MGSGIAESAARAGVAVKLYEPQGAALAAHGRLVANADVVHATVGPGGDGLARAAIALVEKLSGVRATPGLTVPQPTAVRAPRHVLTAPRAPAKKKSGVPVWTSAAIAVGAVALLLAPAFVLARRRRRGPLAAPGPTDLDDPYRYTGP